MGLDITAYRQLKHEADAPVDEDGDPKDWQSYVLFRQEYLTSGEKDWSGRTDGLVDCILKNNIAAQVANLIISNQTLVCSYKDSFHFRVGSYGHYLQWRNWLAIISGWGSAEKCWKHDKSGGPFYELIHFPDCQGVIGPVVSAKLATDFAEFEPIAIEAGNGEYLGLYCDWKKAFEMAADGGCVDYH